MFKLKQVMSSGYRSDSKVSEVTEQEGTTHDELRSPDCLKKTSILLRRFNQPQHQYQQHP